MKVTFRVWLAELPLRMFHRFERILCKFSAVPDQPFFEPAIFPWIAEVESEWAKIRVELDDILKEREKLPAFHEISPEQKYITQDDKWKTFLFFAYGNKSEKNCARCPETARIVESIPGMKTAFFSILAADKHVPPHRGPFKGVLRYHLGLLVPQPPISCRIQVGNFLAFWEEGKSLVFDDTYPHQVWNQSDKDRAILFVDFERPFRFPFNIVNQIMIWLIKHSSYIRESWKRQMDWEEMFHQDELDK